MSFGNDASVKTLILYEGDPIPNDFTSKVILRLTHEECRLFATLRCAVESIEKGEIPSSDATNVELRIAGGWVRDKLLNLSTSDVDIVTDSISGVAFASILQSYLKLNHPDEVHKVGVIAANPNQSKHLETATMVVMGFECDFCNLRSNEVYSEDSRIPLTQIGTPLEDAQRRDFCLNALFFNLKTNLIEDWTGRGLSDLLDQRILVTPLDPFTTFLDDPLRVLRAVRFATRFDFELDKKLREASKSEIIHQALIVKVSRERVGKELEGMLSGEAARPYHALALIDELNLSDCVFYLPCDLSIDGNFLGTLYSGSVKYGWNVSTSNLEKAVKVKGIHFSDRRAISVMDDRLFVLASYLLPFRDVYYVDKKAKKIPVIDYLMRESIKFKNKDVAGMVNMMENADSFAAILQDPTPTRLELGLLIGATKELWVTCLFLAAVLIDDFDKAQILYKRIIDLELDDCWKTRPILNGRDVTEILGLSKGPDIGIYIEEQKRWMLCNPLGTRDECVSHLLIYKRNRDTKRHLGVEELEESKKTFLGNT
jgi:tRNA nucleotidyltransferase (CCA-adding enzyme)